MRMFSKIFKKKVVISNTKGKTEAKDSQSKEQPGIASAGDFVSPQYETISYEAIQNLYDTSPLLKQYIGAILTEALRYKFAGRAKKGYEGKTKTKTRIAYLNQLLAKCSPTETFMEVREKYIKDLYLYGRAGIELEPTTTPNVEAMYAVPGYCIRLNVDETGSNFKNPKKAYKLMHPEETDKEVASFPQDSLVYLVLDKMSDRVYGSDPITSIYTELQTDINTSNNLKAGSFSTKSGVLCLPKAPKKILKDIIERITAMCRKNSRVKIVASNVDGKFIDFSNLNLKDNIDLQKWLVTKANIWNIPPFQLGLAGEAGSLNAREQRDNFRSLIERLVRYELSKLNAILVTTKLGFEDVELYCPNLATKLSYERARIAVRLVNGKIITPNEARVTYLGLDSHKDPRADQLQIPEESEKPKVDDK